MFKKRSVLDFLGDALGLVFFGALTLLSAAHLIITGSPLSFGLAVYNALLAVTLAMRAAPLRSSTLPEMALGLTGSLLPFVSVVLNAVLLDTVVLDTVVERVAVGELALLGFTLQVVSLIWMIASVAALGKSFGVAPADRGLVVSGPYRVVRHPLYLGELAFYAGVLTARPSVLLLALWIALAGIQVARLKAEEGVINRYGEYTQAVPWRLVPGVW